MSDNSLSVEDKLYFEQLKEKHKDVFENDAILAIAHWKPPQLGEPSEEPSEAEYLARAKKSIKGLGPYIKRVADSI